MIGRKRRERLDAAIVKALTDIDLALSSISICSLVGRRSGTIHPALARLQREGRIASRWVEAPVGVPRLRVYYVPKPGGLS